MSAATFEYDFTDNRDCTFWSRQEALTRTFSRTLPDNATDLMDVLGAVYHRGPQVEALLQRGRHRSAQDQYSHSGQRGRALVVPRAT